MTFLWIQMLKRHRSWVVRVYGCNIEGCGFQTIDWESSPIIRQRKSNLQGNGKGRERGGGGGGGGLHPNFSYAKATQWALIHIAMTAVRLRKHYLYCYTVDSCFLKHWWLILLLNVGSVCHIELTLVISTSLISNNRLSRSENLIPA